jgi:hypothetical protein
MKQETFRQVDDKLNENNSSSSQRYNSSRMDNRALPNMNDLIEVKREIQSLSNEETHLRGTLRNEFRRQLSEVRNLYRMVRSGILDSRIQMPPKYSRGQTELLLNNWSKMKSSLIIAGAFCV